MIELPHSAALFERAVKRIPGGVNSPVRAYKSVGGTPPFVARAEGPYVWDEDDRKYVDLVMSFGPHLLGHGHPAIRQAIHDQADVGLCYGAPTRGEVEIAELLCELVPSLEMVRLVNSGTEATMAAIRLARAFTGRAAIVKFDGNYHGHGDSFLVKAGSGALTQGAPDSPGVPAALAGLTLVAQYNKLETVEALFAAKGAEIAAIIVEPVCGNVGLLKPAKGFLEGLRAICDRHGALLVFDEVMTGFRVAKGGYQEICKVRPDLTTLGKVIGGGLPVGAYGGRRDVMSRVAPAGDCYQAGTLSGNPMAVQAGLAMLGELSKPGVYGKLEDAGAHLEAGLDHICRSLKIPAVVQRQGSMMCLYFAEKACTTLDAVMASDRAKFRTFFHGMLEHGVLLPPSPFESWFLSTAHDAAALDLVLEAAREALRRVAAC
jgi:glutamate-1-semialdehyde 2,1-aminomutase